MMRGCGLTAASAALALTVVAFAGQPAAAQTLVDRTVTGQLAQGDQLSSEGTYVDCHPLSITPGHVATVIMTSNLEGQSLKIANGSDCRGGVLPSSAIDRINSDQGDTALRFLAQQAEYGVIVDSFLPGQTGPYTLHILAEAPDVVAAESFVRSLRRRGAPSLCASVVDLRRMFTDDLATRWPNQSLQNNQISRTHTARWIEEKRFSDERNYGDNLFTVVSPDGRTAYVGESQIFSGRKIILVFSLLNSERGWRLDDVIENSFTGTTSLRGELSGALERGATRPGQCPAS